MFQLIDGHKLKYIAGGAYLQGFERLIYPLDLEKPQAILMVKRFSNIDALRAFAAISVMIMHVVGHTAWKDQYTPSLWWFWNAWLGVDLFYVISGFVISHACFYSYEKTREGFRWRFLLRRFARIAPLFYLTNILFAVVVEPSYLNGPLISQLYFFGTHFLFIHNFFHDAHSSLNSVSWTIGIEMQFYLIMTIFTPIFMRLNPYFMLFLSLVIGVSYRIIIHLSLLDQGVDFFNNFVWQSQLPGSIEEFALGVFLARAVTGTVKLPNLSRTAAMTFCAGSVVILFFIIVEVLGAIGYQYLWQTLLQLAIGKPIIALAWAAAVTVAILYQRTSVGIKIMDVALDKVGDIVLYLGQISYGIYLWHFPVIIFLEKKVPHWTPVSVLISTVVITMILSVVSWHFYEKYFIKLGAFLATRRPQANVKQAMASPIQS